MIAFAVYYEYKHIELYGVHMSSLEEYAEQRQACEAWLAYADAKGADIYIPDMSQIFRNPYLYGYEQEGNTLVKIREFKAQLQGAEKKLKIDLEKARENYWQQAGALKVVERLESTFK